VPPAVEIEGRLHRRPFQRRSDPVGVGIIVGPSRYQHDGAALDQFLKARMMIEFFRQSGSGHDQRPAGLHASEDAGTPRGEALIERIAEDVDLAEQAEHFMVGRDEAGDDHVVGNAECGGPGMKIFLDPVEAANERPDIDDQRLEAAFLQDRADIEQRVRPLARIDRSEMTDHQLSAFVRGGEPLAQFGIGDSGWCLDIRRQRRQYALPRGPAGHRVGNELAPDQRREHDNGIGERQRRKVGDPPQPVQAAPFVLNQDNPAPLQLGHRQRQQWPKDHPLPGHDREVTDHAPGRADGAPDLGERPCRPRQG